MTTIFTPSIGLAKQATGTNDQVWGDVLNDGMIGLVDDALAGRTDIDVTAGNVQLTTTPGAADQARAMFILISAGTPGITRDVIVPTLDKVYLVHNNVGDGSDVVFRTSLGVGVTVADGTRTALYVDGTLGTVIEIGLSTGGGGSSIAPMGQATITASVFRNNDGTGSRFPNVATNFQGNIGLIFIPAVNDQPVFELTINDTQWVLEPQAGLYPTTPTLEDMTFHMLTMENGTPTNTILVYYADGTAMEFFRADGAAWTFGSDRAINRAFNKPLMFGLTGT